MWLFCGGMGRSGSTLQYQIAKKIVEISKKGKGLGWIDPLDFSRLYEKYKVSDKIFVVKSHVLTKEMNELFKKKEAKAVYIFRDLRSVMVSNMKKENTSFRNLLFGGFLNNCIKNYYVWTSLSNISISKYEKVVNNIIGEVKKISIFLDISLNKSICKNIAKQLSLDNQKKRISNFKNKNLIKYNKYYFDKATLLHNNHIFSGKIDSWKGNLTETEVNLVETKFRKWFKTNNYNILTKKLSKFNYFLQLFYLLFDNTKLNIDLDYKFYSQHGEDYLIWKFFDFKKNGFFIDIGAFDGIYLNNTYSFEKNGWDGICIEANPLVFNICKKKRDCKCLNYALQNKRNIGNLPFYIDKTRLFFSLKNEKMKNFKKINIKTTNLNYILEKYLPNKKEIDFISINVKSVELNVLKGFNFFKYRPRILIVKANNEDLRKKIKKYLKRFGYFDARKMDVNSFFVRNKKDAEKLKQIKINCHIESLKHPLNIEFNSNKYEKGLRIKDKFDSKYIKVFISNWIKRFINELLK